MTLAVVRNLGSPLVLRSAQEIEDFEQEIVDQYALAMAAAGLSDGHVANSRSVIIEFAISRYQGDIHALTGFVVQQPIDEFNRQLGASLGKIRVPPSDAEVDELGLQTMHKLARHLGVA